MKQFELFKSEIRLVYKKAEKQHLTQKYINELLKPIRESINNSKLRQYEKFGLHCYRQALHDLLSEQMIFGYFIEGKFYSVDSRASNYYGHKWTPEQLLKMNLKGGMYWPDSNKVWFE